MFEALTALILRYRWAAGFLLLLVISSVLAGLTQLGVDFSISNFFGRNDPETAYLAEYLDRWGEDDLMIIAFETDEERGLLQRRRLERMDEVANAIGEVEGVGAVVALTQQPQVNRGPGGTFIPVPLLATAPKDASDVERVKRWQDRVLADPRIVPSQLSADGRYGGMLVALDVDATDIVQVTPVVHRVEELLRDIESEGVTIHVAGVPAIRADILDVIITDQIVLAPVSGILMGLLLLLLFRSKHGVIIPGVAAVVPIAMLLGIMGWTGEKFGLINQVFLALVPAIAVADAIHFISRYHEESRALAADREMTLEERDLAIQRAMSTMGVACFLTSFTTIVGFLSLLATDMNALRMFGLYAAVGVAFAYLTVLFIVPLALLGTRSSARKLDHNAEGWLGTLLEGSVQVTTRAPWLCIAGAVLMSVGFTYAGTYVTVDTKVTQSFNEDHPTTKGNNIVDTHLGGVVALEYELVASPGAFRDPEVLAALDRSESYARKKDEVRATWSPAALLRATSVLLGGKDVVPTSDNVIRTLYRVNEDTPSLASTVSPEADRARLIVRVVDVGAAKYLELGRTLSERFRVELEPLGVQAHLTGSSYVAYRGLAHVSTDLRDSLGMAFVFIGIIIATLFRSVSLGALSLLPNALPLIFGYGLLGIMGWTLEPAPAIVFTIAIGVAVDSAIHVIARFREEREKGETVDQAIRESIFHSGRAVVITAIILIVGFAVNTYSSSPANASFGMLGAIVVAGAIVSNLLVLPALLKVLADRGRL
jgi:predicted RND superfamily exporter protein